MKRKKAYTPVEIEPLLIFFAELVDEYGPVMQPWLDRMEAEYEKAKQPPPPKQLDRIMAKLAAEKAGSAAPT